MGLFNNLFKSKKEERLDEAIKAFNTEIESKKDIRTKGEGLTDIVVTGYGIDGISSFNNFYNKFINIQYENEQRRILDYRNIAQMPEISDVIEDAVIESTQEDQEDGEVIKLEILDEKLKKNENIVNNLRDEFYELFYNRVDVKEIL
jgi:hypothetical protein